MQYTRPRKAPPSAERRIWQGMKTRCYNPKRGDYHRYGGRGITVCGRWRDDFAAFLADMGPRPSSLHTLERIDSRRHY